MPRFVGMISRKKYLEADVVAGLVDHLARLSQLVEGAGDEALPAEARVNRHEQDDVDLVKHVLGVVQRSGGVEHESCCIDLRQRRGGGTLVDCRKYLK